ncbi:D-tyrosyl-tRNA deacylase [Heterostelium album PN500]|uniref:D-aminoacyl-tRNA deacylase n=1 Tax=Heterostelium pallidum (strain ATCC 26659 / Pp 5 / PN500) TaxID=670386 RepID=D3BQQ8_HETP5|nr:D-tyrosyl-tRNA deacylase [Heterostelium album PN500]EFA76478.1 D-tyrosyl-tRNA deacylase [Heterostelium album PN500]|eukprot:XP_020428610.1 D-tyrosyl-tRNA deacylase [Heterostelium album PN500]
MRAVIQRVKQGSVTVNNEVISSIGQGLVCLIGITHDDTKVDSDWLLWDNKEANKSWDKSVKDMNYEVLFVSQFTLYAVTKKGTKPDFHCAMPSELSKQFYTQFLNDAKQNYKPELIKDGCFGAMMDVGIVNDGPVTIVLDSKDK